MDESNKMIGIIVGIIVVLIIVGVVFAIIAFSNNAMDNAMDGMAQQLGAMDDASFMSYDNKTISGANLKAAMENFKGQPVTIMIQTRSSAPAFSRYLAGVNDGVTDLGAAGTAADPATGHPPTALPTTIDTMAGRHGAGGMVSQNWDRPEAYNTDFRPTTRANSPNYIRDTARFECALILDNNETIIGFYAIQQ